MADNATSAANEEPGGKVARRVNWRMAGAVGGLVAAGVAGVVFAFYFVAEERARELQAWQIRLGIVADSRAAAVDEWIEQNFATLRDLTENASLQLYFTELALAQGDRAAITDEGAQAGYLRNLLVAVAERSGFKPPPAAGDIAANVERTGIAGIGLVDGEGRSIVATPAMPPPTGRFRAGIAKALEGEPAVIDLHMGASNLPTMGFALPIFAVQDSGAKAIGAVVGVRIVGEGLYERLKQPGATEETAETYLVRGDGQRVDYLSPLRDGTAALKRALDAATPDLADVRALEKPGGFVAARDYAGDAVLAVSRPVAGVPWVLVRKISRGEALAAVETRLNTILVVFILIIVGVGVTLIAVWRHATSVRAQEAAERFRISSERFENISKFMRLVTNSQNSAIVAVDGTTTYTFANEPAAREGGLTPADMLGKTMAAVVGPVKAKAFAEVNAQVLKQFADLEADGAPDSRERARRTEVFDFEMPGTPDGVQVIQTDHIPLRGDRDHPPGVLMVLSDITELTRERRRSEAMMRQLVNTLVGVADRRDPDAANRSTRTAEVAKCIAEEMTLGAEVAKTCDVAGSLLNLGKLLIPSQLLAKGAAALSDAEREQVARSHLVSADLLSNVPFASPVVETIRLSGERPDGRGPLKFAADVIPIAARVVAVARAFVEAVSPHGNRDGATFDEAVAGLLAEVGKRLDRRPVTALINVLDNRGGAERWAAFRRPAGAS